MWRAGNRVLLIGGHVRSGTTLVRQLCNAHPDMAITHELRCFAAPEESYGAHARYILDDCLKRAKRLPHEAIPRFRLTSRYLWRLRMHYDNRAGGVQAMAVEAALRDLFPGTRIVGDKTPLYVFHLARLVKKPQLSILVVVRDARDVVNSTLERVKNGRWGTYWHNIDTHEAVAQRWVRAMLETERHREQVQVIRYEDLVREPANELNRLAAWLNVNADGFRVNLIRNSSIGKYKEHQTQQEVDKIMQVAGPLMERFGYV